MPTTITALNDHRPARDFEAELREAFRMDRTPGASAAQRNAACRLAESIAEQAEAQGHDLWARFYAIDEDVRLAMYPEQ